MFSPTTSPRWGTPPPRRRRIKIVLLDHLIHYYFRYEQNDDLL